MSKYEKVKINNPTFHILIGFQKYRPFSLNYDHGKLNRKSFQKA